MITNDPARYTAHSFAITPRRVLIARLGNGVSGRKGDGSARPLRVLTESRCAARTPLLPARAPAGGPPHPGRRRPLSCVDTHYFAYSRHPPLCRERTRSLC